MSHGLDTVGFPLALSVHLSPRRQISCSERGCLLAARQNRGQRFGSACGLQNREVAGSQNCLVYAQREGGGISGIGFARAVRGCSFKRAFTAPADSDIEPVVRFLIEMLGDPVMLDFNGDHLLKVKKALPAIPTTRRLSPSARSLYLR